MDPPPKSSPSFTDSSMSTNKRGDPAYLRAVDTAVDIIKEVSEILVNIPYVKAVAGIGLQILKIKDELASNKEQCRELIDSVARRCVMLFQGLKKIAESKTPDRLEDMKSDLLEYTQLLEEIQDCLAQFTSKGTMKRISRYINRKDLADQMKKYEARMKEFDDIFKNNRLINMEINISTLIGTVTDPPLRMRYRPELPPEPPFVFGRSDEIEAIVTSLTSDPKGRVAILGPGGMGKTTIAACVTHHDRTSAHYTRRLFVACDGITSLDLLLAELASTLHIPPERQDYNVYNIIIDELAKPATFLCLDNFETPWEPPETRPSIEEFLSRVAGLANVALLVTMRGTQHPAPSAIIWSKPLPRALEPVGADAAADIFEKISGKRDEFSCKLTHAVDRLPLAISLLAQLVSEEGETTKNLWITWEKRRDRTRMLENTGHDRLSNLDVSIQLSLDSPRMTTDAHIVLGILALLPDGFPDTPDMKADFQSYLSAVAFDDGLTALKRVALAQTDNVPDETQRIRLLSPIRDFVLGNNKIHAPPSVQKAVLEFYFQFMNARKDYTNRDNQIALSPELLNLHTLFNHARESAFTSPSICKASISYTMWMRYNGIYSDEVIQWVIQAGGLSISQEADCINCVGLVCMRRDKFVEAEKSFERAAKLHRQALDVLGEGTDINNLGEVYLHWDRLDEAQKLFEQAAELHRQVHSTLGEGYALRNLGKVYMLRSELDKAEKSFERAAELHRQVNSGLGEGYALKNLGKVYMLQDKLDKAKKSFERAAELHRQAHNALGESIDLNNLGKVYMLRDELDKAEKSFERASELHRQAHDVLGEGNSLKNLGKVYMRRDELDKAEKSVKRAAELHRQAHNVLGEGYDLRYLGEVYMRRGQLNEAENSFERAAELHRQAHDVVGEGNNLILHGAVRMSRGELSDAESLMKRGLDLIRKSQNVESEKFATKWLDKLESRRAESL